MIKLGWLLFMSQLVRDDKHYWYGKIIKIVGIVFKDKKRHMNIRGF